MTNRIIIACICTIFISELMTYCQTPVIMVKPDDGSDRWGFANLNGDMIIPAKFEKCYSFSEDGIALFYFRESSRYFFINLEGEILSVEPHEFRVNDALGYAAEGFHNGLAVILNHKKWGCLNTEGKIAIPLQYDWISRFNDGYATAIKEDRHYVLNKMGGERLIAEANIQEIKAFSEHMAAFESGRGLFGFIDTLGNVIIPAQYWSVGYFKNGLTWARTKDGELGYINASGKWVIEPQYLEAKDFDKESGLARVKTLNGWAWVDTCSKLYNFNISESFHDFSEGQCIGRDENGMVGFHNNKNEWVIKPSYEGARDFKNGYAAVKTNKRWGLINKQGEWVIPPKYLGIKDVVIVK